MICPAPTLVTSCAPKEAQASETSCSIPNWSFEPVENTHSKQFPTRSKKKVKYNFDFVNFDCLALAGLVDVGDPHWLLQCLLSSLYSKIRLIINVDSSKQVWFSLKMINNILAYSLVGFNLFIIQQSWHRFYADSLHTQISGDYHPCTDLVSCPTDVRSFEQSIVSRLTLIALSTR